MCRLCRPRCSWSCSPARLYSGLTAEENPASSYPLSLLSMGYVSRTLGAAVPTVSEKNDGRPGGQREGFDRTTFSTLESTIPAITEPGFVFARLRKVVLANVSCPGPARRDADRRVGSVARDGRSLNVGSLVSTKMNQLVVSTVLVSSLSLAVDNRSAPNRRVSRAPLWRLEAETHVTWPVILFWRPPS